MQIGDKTKAPHANTSAKAPHHCKSIAWGCRNQSLGEAQVQHFRVTEYLWNENIQHKRSTTRLCVCLLYTLRQLFMAMEQKLQSQNALLVCSRIQSLLAVISFRLKQYTANICSPFTFFGASWQYACSYTEANFLDPPRNGTSNEAWAFCRLFEISELSHGFIVRFGILCY